jgi:hypothetical protein
MVIDLRERVLGMYSCILYPFRDMAQPLKRDIWPFFEGN